MLKPALTVSLKVGEDPFIYSGWDNGGSTGYTWKVDVSSNAIGYFQTKNDQRSTAHLCGGGMAFEYQFHPLQVGSSEVKIFHGRPWENNNKETILFHVGALNEEESSTLESVGLGLGNHWSRLALFGSFSFGTGKNNGKHVLINSEA